MGQTYGKDRTRKALVFGLVRLGAKGVQELIGSKDVRR